ncbi:MAG: hypothetical protein AAB217_07665, partial [Chloroflexota bacterium]
MTATKPELWIYDERLLKPSTRPIELVWRMDVTATDLQPIDELVLVNAHSGGISLHFNQIDAAWGEGQRPTTANVMLAPTTYYVATTGNDLNSCTTTGAPCATINGAIGKAAASGDTIKVAVGTYTGTGTEVVLANKSVTLSGGWDAAFTTQSGAATIDGQGTRRGFVVNSSVTVAVERFVVRNGLFNEPVFSTNGGGGIRNDGHLTLNNSTITNNIGNNGTSVGGGGGIFNVGTLILNNSIVSNNVGTNGSILSSGGGIYNDGGTLTLNSSTISGNVAVNNSGDGRGGGIFNVNNGTATIN